MSKKLNLTIDRPYGSNFFVLRMSWKGFDKCRLIKIDLNKNDVYEIPREGIRDIKRMCEEFLDGTDRSHEYLQIGKNND